MDKKVRKKIEYAFYHYSELLKVASLEVVDLAYRNIAVSYDKPAVKSSVGLTMQDKICALMDKTSANYRWAMVVEKTIEHYAWDIKKELIIARYFKKCGKIKTLGIIGISDRTYCYWLNEILELAEKWAIQLGVLNVSVSQSN